MTQMSDHSLGFAGKRVRGARHGDIETNLPRITQLVNAQRLGSINPRRVSVPYWLSHRLVAVMLWLIRPLGGDAQVFRLLGRQLGQFHAELVEVESRDFFVQMFG